MTKFDIDELAQETHTTREEIIKKLKEEYTALMPKYSKDGVVDQSACLAMAQNNVWIAVKQAAGQAGEDIRLKICESADPFDWTAEKHKNIQAYINKNGKFEAEKNFYIRIVRNPETNEEISIQHLYYWPTKEGTTEVNKMYKQPLPAKSYLMSIRAACRRVGDPSILYFANISLSGEFADPTNAKLFRPIFGKEIELKAAITGVTAHEHGDTVLWLSCANANYTVITEPDQELLSDVKMDEFIKKNYNTKLDKYSDLRFCSLSKMVAEFKPTWEKKDGAGALTGKQTTDPIYASMVNVVSLQPSGPDGRISHRITVSDPKDETVTALDWVDKRCDISLIGPGSKILQVYKASRQDSVVNPGTKEYHCNVRGLHPIKTKLAQISGLSTEDVQAIIGLADVPQLGTEHSEEPVAAESFPDISDEDMKKILEAAGTENK
jgi:hypothetical protein